MSVVFEHLRGGLIVSVQAYPGSLLNAPEVIALLARVAVANGAVAVRVEGVDRLHAVRAAVDVPVIGLIKREHAGFEPYITSTRDEIDAVLATGADLVAFDATDRPHADGLDVAGAVARIRASGRTAMADCATLADLHGAASAGAGIVATTLAGYTAGTRGRALPALDLVAATSGRLPFVVCEGGIGTPEAARDAFAAGAAAVVVGTAITNVDALVARFVAASPRAQIT